MIQVVSKDRDVIKKHITIEAGYGDYPPDIYEIAVVPYITISLSDFASAKAYDELKEGTHGVVRLVYEYQERIGGRFYLYRFAGVRQ